MSHVQDLTRANLLLGNKNGRDKLYKTLQYLLKLILELSHLCSVEHRWLPHLKRFSLRLSQSRALFRLGSFLADLERFEILLTKEKISWLLFEKLLTCFTVLVSNWFDSLACVNGIIRRDVAFSLHYSTLFWMLGIFGDVIRQSRALHQAFKAESKLKQDKKKEIDPAETEALKDLTHGQELTMATIQEVKQENAIGIVKSLCDSVTALSILYPVSVGKYRIFVCSCGLFAGSVGLVQNWNGIKVK